MMGKKSKKRVLLEGLGVALLVFVICFVMLMVWVNSRFNEFYYKGYKDATKICNNNTEIPYYENPFGINIEKGIEKSINISVDDVLP